MSFFFEKYPEVGLVFSDALVVDNSLTSLGYSVYDQIPVKKYIDRKLRPGEFTYFFFRKLALLGCLTAIRKVLYNELIPLPNHWSHDKWFPMAASINKEVVCISDKLLYYRQHHQQLYGIGKENYIKKILNTINIDFYSFRKRYLFIKMLWLECLLRLAKDNNKYIFFKEIIDYLNHLDNRYNLSKPFLDKIIIIIKELIKGNYKKLSNGIISFVYDIYIYLLSRLLKPLSR
jgi:hypothetical protein